MINQALLSRCPVDFRFDQHPTVAPASPAPSPVASRSSVETKGQWQQRVTEIEFFMC